MSKTNQDSHTTCISISREYTNVWARWSELQEKRKQNKSRQIMELIKKDLIEYDKEQTGVAESAA